MESSRIDPFHETTPVILGIHTKKKGLARHIPRIYPSSLVILCEFPRYFWSPPVVNLGNPQVQRAVHGMDPMEQRNWHLP